jgi:hypothetical protein
MKAINDMYSTLKRWFLALWAKIPIVGALAATPYAAKKKARAEVATAIFFATMPLWFPLIIRRFMINPPSLNPIGQGELLVYAAGLFGPMIYVISKRYGNFNVISINHDGTKDITELTLKFPYSGLFAIIASVACVFSGIAFTLLKLPGLFNGMPVRLDYAFIQAMSVAFFVFAVVIFYCVTVYRNKLEIEARGDPEVAVEMQRVQETNFAHDFEEQNK